MRFLLSLLFAGSLAAVSASNVLELGPDNFDAVIGKGKPALVEFMQLFPLSCHPCLNSASFQTLAPIYEQLGDAFAHDKEKVIIAKIDSDGDGRSIAQKHGVTGFPTLKWFDANGKVEDYEAGRDLDSLAMFVMKKTSLLPNIKAPPPLTTLLLDAHSFDDIALDEAKDVLVTFTAPWCGHCKTLKPIYEEGRFNAYPEPFPCLNCIVANMDADAALNKEIAGRYGVASYPTIKFFPRGGKEVESYEGARTEEAFVTFLNERCGTHRAVGGHGGLNDQAGRLAELDSVAQKFLAAVGDARDAIFKEAEALSGSFGATSEHYLRVMAKIVSSSEGYVAKESQRLASLLSKRTLAPTKLDEIKIKANILKAFALEKVESVIGREKDEL
ncbi:thioredoxin-domain-containing protein [Boletus reticuloceps]|uniref:protein disulfide-isomerase n=1 Tax=Boletus reticuloceps TaxID=495285 RepID=A0A8I2YJX0_9AGAM|nr:thioredoxin-domain-containing protein [Boletus reticuloceps]